MNKKWCTVEEIILNPSLRLGWRERSANPGEISFGERERLVRVASAQEDTVRRVVGGVYDKCLYWEAPYYTTIKDS